MGWLGELLLSVLLQWPVLLAILLGLGFMIFRNRRETEKATDEFFRNFRIGGHRGSPKAYPENTMASMYHAMSEGADLVEFDVSLTKDGIAVLLHDDTLDRTTNMSGRIRDFTLEQLRECNCAAKFAGEPALVKTNGSTKLGTMPLPTLEEMVKWAKHQRMKMLFDIKDADTVLIETLEKLFLKYHIFDQGIVCSFYPHVIYAIKRRDPRILTGFTWCRWFHSFGDLELKCPRYSGLLQMAAVCWDMFYHWSAQTWLPGFLGADMVLTERKDISATFVQLQAAANRRVCAWTVNDLHEMQWMRNVLGIPILTDFPSRAKRISQISERKGNFLWCCSH